MLVQDKSHVHRGQGSCWCRRRVMLVEDNGPVGARQEFCSCRTRGMQSGAQSIIIAVYTQLSLLQLIMHFNLHVLNKHKLTQFSLGNID